jgi:hypothetical protein
MKIDKEIKFKKNNHKTIIPVLGIIIIVGFALRINYISFETPVIADAIHIFFYASEIANRGQLSDNYIPFNPGLSIILSGFISIISFDNVIEYMQIQKILSILFSVITVIPIYFLCKKFVNEKFAIIGSVIFIFEPHLVQNSLLGISDSLYFLLLTTSLVFVLSQKKELELISFFIVGIAVSVRTEAIFLLFAISLIFIIKNRKNKKKIFFISICILVFLIPFSSISIIKSEIMGDDADVTRMSEGFSGIISEERGGSGYRISVAIENFLKYFGWSLIPIFIILLPIGLFDVIKNRDERLWIFLSIGICLILPMLYAYSIPLNDTRYVYTLFPIFLVISLIGINHFSKKLKKEKFFLGITLGLIIISSITFIEWKVEKPENAFEKFNVSQEVIFIANGVNAYHPQSQYLESAKIPDKLKDLEQMFSIDREEKRRFNINLDKEFKVFETNGYETINQFIQNNQGLTHIVVDNEENRSEFLKDIYKNGEKISFLIKVYESDASIKYKAKIFEINYEEFNAQD